MRLVDVVETILTHIEGEATSREDGNTEALVRKIRRDLRTLQPEYQGMTVKDISVDPGSFLPASYEKTGAKDVNELPKPPTGENADAPFVSKSDVGEDGKVITNADNQKEGATRTNKGIKPPVA